MNVRKPLLLLALPVAALAQPATQQPPQPKGPASATKSKAGPDLPKLSADQIVAKAIAARGGADKIKAVQSQKISGKIAFGPDAEGPFFVEYKRPGKMHMEFSIAGQTMVRVYNGNGSGWIINPFSDGDKGVQPMSGDELKNISDESDFDGPLVDYQAKGNKIEFDGTEDIDGKSAYRIKLTTKTGNVRFYSYDAESFLLAQWGGSRTDQGKTIYVASLFRDYRDVHGLKYAFQIDSGSPRSPVVQQITVEKIDLDLPLDESAFLRPTGPAPAADSPAPAGTGAATKPN